MRHIAEFGDPACRRSVVDQCVCAHMCTKGLIYRFVVRPEVYLSTRSPSSVLAAVAETRTSATSLSAPPLVIPYDVRAYMQSNGSVSAGDVMICRNKTMPAPRTLEIAPKEDPERERCTSKCKLVTCSHAPAAI